ncbi:arylsulfatase [Rhizorhabdus histidinilytica]|uniref:arylsulfatase n=1 Tax=Rhizorhabdus histidinilytica TaxID=439228 RepID=UPI00321FD97E
MARPGRSMRAVVRMLAGGSLLAAGLAFAAVPPPAPGSAAPVVDAPGAQHFAGINPATSSAPSWPEQPQAPKGAPNVLLILTDDIGFGATSTFGGPVPTPAFDALAKEGLRYTQFNTTAICSPTRAALLTGRNPHAVGMGHVENTSAGYEGYDSVIPKSSAFVSRILRQGGYNTAAFGKWHLTPQWEQSQAGPYDRWPLGQGFENFYGFLASDNSQWNPTLTQDNSFIDVATPPGYHFDADMADHAIRWIAERKANAPDKPFFVYYAPGTAHTPNHVPKEWLDRFRGRFDKGWDALREEVFARQKALGVVPADTVLTARPKELPAWSSLSADQRRLYARYMEAWAASVAYMDAQIGRVIQSLKDSGQYDNTLIIYIQGDNGSSAEGGMDGRLFQQSLLNDHAEQRAYALSRIDDIGGPDLYPLFPTGWGWAMDTPFKYYKQIASYFGGTRNGMVMSWPKGIADKGGIRSQYHFVTDIMPTILEATGVTRPASVDGVEQRPLDGVSMAYSFTAPDAPSHRRMQVYEMVDSRGIYLDGWFASMRPTRQPWSFDKPADPDKTPWELYDIRTDFSQAHDLAARHPNRLRMMQQLFWAEAGRNNILPILEPTILPTGRPSLGAGRTAFRYPQGVTRIPEDSAPHIIGRSYSVSTTIEVAAGAPNGVLVAQGGRFGGWALYFRDGRLTYHQNALDPRQYRVVSDRVLGPGRHDVAMLFKADSHARGAGGTVSFTIDGQPAGQGHVPLTLGGWISHIEGLDVGVDTGTPVSGEYRSRDSAFNGRFDALEMKLID